MASQWFDVSKEGLSKILDGQHAKLVLELVQNALDTEATSVHVTMEPVPNSPSVKITVEDDDPDGFNDLSHSYTLFAESEKKADPTKRGRFNLGEKLVLALCKDAKIVSTKGTICFNEDGQRVKSKECTEAGSKFTGTIRMKRDEMEIVNQELMNIISDIPVFVNGVQTNSRTPLSSSSHRLPTLVSDFEGVLKKTVRRADVTIYEVPRGGKARIYEMGIPVVETGDKYDIDIGQKIPMNMNRDNVPPSFLRKIRVIVLNEMFREITHEDANATWAQEASSSREVDKEAFNAFLDQRFGRNRVAYDPSDKEANSRAVNAGATVIAGRSLSKEQWENSRRFSSTKPSGQSQFSTPSPYSDDPNAPQVRLLDESEWDSGMKHAAGLARELSMQAHGFSCNVRITYGARNHLACYAKSEIHDSPDSIGTLDFNLNTLGRKWFDQPDSKMLDLIIHELAHENADNHLSDEFHKECTRIGGEAFEMGVNRGLY
tara:strand:- start:218 stop:1681 length:1464 start_codon:yes stop_codon:yes gene_type:complete